MAEETSAAPEPAADTVAGRARLRRWTHGPARRYVRWGVGVAAVVAAVVIVATVTIDLGPAVRARAEDAASSYLGREVTIGRIGIHLVPGRFLVEDLVIPGLNPGDRPFMNAGRIDVDVSIDWLAQEVLVDAEMTDWRMLAESFPDGTQSFPAFVPQGAAAEESFELDAPTTDPSEEDEGWRFVYTLRHLRAHRGEFVLDDHGSNYGVICANLDLTITKVLEYRGRASCSGGRSASATSSRCGWTWRPTSSSTAPWCT